MLPKRSRISRELFSELLKGSLYAHSDHFILRFTLEGSETRCGVSVSKKISKKAVVRNTIRRRVYSSLRPLLPSLPSGLFLFVAKAGTDAVRGNALVEELKNLLKKTNLLSL